ncbi:MAG: radical SAM protein [Prevotellaceae bacterium]|jgi:wyosine [tRNA(Phe)-imidazoG37] synthetase (radical SAM superfamily)|nr:radical SAM protein [Prevotellaceae bacterium]
MATLLFHNIIFGPVQSRRLGISLGINLLPAHGKWCNFDCLYCECGWNADHRNDRRLPTREQVREALQEKLQRMQQDKALPDAITFSGNGEPTLHPQFPTIMDDAIALRNRLAPQAKICVLSNATNLHKDAVFHALQKTDKPILKVDSAIESSIRRINRPQGHYDIAYITEQLQRFNGQFTLQTLFLRGLFHGEKFDNSTPEEIGKWLDIVQRTHPREIMLYTIHRDTPAQSLQKLAKDELFAIAQQLAAINTWGAEVRIAE